MNIIGEKISELREQKIEKHPFHFDFSGEI